MNLFKFKSLLGALAMMALILTSCSDDSTNPVTPGAKPDPVASIEATSTGSTTVQLKWGASPSATDALFKGYVVDVLKEDGSPTPIASKTYGTSSSTAEITGLEEGTVYTFQIRAQFTTDSLSTAKTIKWSPATRFTQNENEKDILIFEYASDFGSGLRIFDETSKFPKNLKSSSKADWHIGIDTRNGKLIFGSASEISFGTGTPTDSTLISDKYWEASSLNSVFDSEALNAGTFSARAVDLSTMNVKGNIVFVVKIKNGTRVNYAKVMVIKNKTTESFLWPSTTGTNNRFIKLEISYQKGNDIPYAKFPVK